MDSEAPLADVIDLFGRIPVHSHPAVRLPKPPAVPSLMTVRVDLVGATPPVWRRLELRGDLTLDVVHAVLQAAMGWGDVHLHNFLTAPGNGLRLVPFLTQDDLDEGERGTPEAEVRLDQVLRSPGDILRHDYDFGDGWSHRLRLEAVSPLPADAPDARCTAGAGSCPPEDCGGIHVWNDLAALLRAGGIAAVRGDERYAEYADWLPPGTDPDAFDVTLANRDVGLVGADVETILAAVAPAGAAPVPPVEALEELMDLALPAERLELARLAATAWHDPGQATPAELERFLIPWQVLLDCARGEGIPLTAAGWMAPAVVHRIWTDGGLDWGYGAGNREQNVPEVAQLRADAMALRLLRKNKGRLLLTPRGRRAVDDQGLLARIVAGQYVETEHGGRRLEAALALLLLANLPGETRMDVFAIHCRVRADVAEWLGRLGWLRGDHLPLDGQDMVVTGRVADRVGLTRHGPPDLMTVRRLARLGLWGQE